MEWSLKEREGGRMEAERETQRGRDLGLKEDRETEEAEADMALSFSRYALKGDKV